VALWAFRWGSFHLGQEFREQYVPAAQRRSPEPALNLINGYFLPCIKRLGNARGEPVYLKLEFSCKV
jgi:hypothetical protein